MVRKSELGAGGQRFLLAFLVVTILILGGAVFYLLSDLHQRKFQLRQVGNELQVERGRFLPFGFIPYEPELASLKAVYAPLKLPGDFRFGMPRVFNDRIELDLELFSLLSGWFRQVLDSSEERDFRELQTLMERMSSLPSLAGEQRRELGRLGADYSYWEGRTIVEGIVDELEKAKQAFARAISEGSTYKSDAQERLSRLESRLEKEFSEKVEDEGEQKPEGSLELPSSKEELAEKANSGEDGAEQKVLEQDDGKNEEQ